MLLIIGGRGAGGGDVRVCQRYQEGGSELAGRAEVSYLPLFPALPEHIPVALVIGILQAQ